jgi:hypothetical protein
MISYYGKSVEIKECNFSNINNSLTDIHSKGFCFLKNAVKIDFNYEPYLQPFNSFKIHKVFDQDSKEYKDILSQILSSALFKELINSRNSIFVSSVVLRALKNEKGAMLHKDSDIFIDSAFDYNIFTCWTPLTNTTLETGTIAIVDRFKNHKHRSKCIIKKNNLLKDLKNIIDIQDRKKLFKANLEDYQTEKNLWLQHGDKFYAKNLCIGDAALFSKETLHGSLDSNNDLLRVSLDFRVAVLPKN